MGEQEPNRVSAVTGETLVCRYCLDAGNEELLRVCACRGSQEYVHITCLRRWQACVMTNATHPSEVNAEQRHRICGVCNEPFRGVPPPSRLELLTSFAQLDPADLKAGTMLRYANVFPSPDVEDPSMLILFTSKMAHFENSVYLITAVEPCETHSSEDDVIFGVNLVRDAPTVWADSILGPMSLWERSGGAVSDHDVETWEQSGVHVEMSIGGPVKPRKLVNSLLISSTEEDGWAMDRLDKLAHRATAAAQSSNPGSVELRIFFGQARWSRSQLLGEIARGSWGVSLRQPSSEELRACSGHGSSLWHRLADTPGRLHSAPANSMREDYNRRSSRS